MRFGDRGKALTHTRCISDDESHPGLCTLRGLRMENTGSWPQVAQVHVKGMISMSPDTHKKALASLTPGICFSLTNDHLLLL